MSCDCADALENVTAEMTTKVAAVNNVLPVSFKMFFFIMFIFFDKYSVQQVAVVFISYGRAIVRRIAFNDYSIDDQIRMSKIPSCFYANICLTIL